MLTRLRRASMRAVLWGLGRRIGREFVWLDIRECSFNYLVRHGAHLRTVNSLRCRKPGSFDSLRSLRMTQKNSVEEFTDRGKRVRRYPSSTLTRFSPMPR